MVWFVKGKYTNRFIIQDGISPAMQDKRFHGWGQPEDGATYWLYEMLQRLENSITFDPFVGGGTVPAVCKMLGRNYLAFEIDPDTAERARQRVAQTQPPLFVLQPEQVEMELRE